MSIVRFYSGPIKFTLGWLDREDRMIRQHLTQQGLLIRRGMATSRLYTGSLDPGTHKNKIIRSESKRNTMAWSFHSGCSKLNWRLHFFMHHAYVDISLKIADLSTLPFRVFCPTCVHHFIFSTQTFKSKPEHDTKNQLNIC